MEGMPATWTGISRAALIVAVLAAEHVGHVSQIRVHQLAGQYLSFLENAFNEKTGRFRNFLSFDRRWLEETGSEVCHGRALWGLGVTEGHSSVPRHASLAAELFRQALPASFELEHPHAWAYSLLGIHEHLRHFAGDSYTKRIRDELAFRLFNCWREEAGDDWPWITNTLTYANGRLVQALLLSGRRTFTDTMIELALKSLRWLLDVQTAIEGHFQPIGCTGWFPKGGQKALFDQQPIEAAGMINACLEAYRITADRYWNDRAQWCFNWFFGYNDLRQPIYDQRTGGCSDALAPHGVNENQGAESVLSWLMSLLAFYDQLLDGKSAGTGDASPEVKAGAESPEEKAQPTAFT